MTFLDRVLKRVGLQRLKQRNANPYVGAANSRLLMDWARAPLSADREAEGDLLVLRARARDLRRNNAYAKRVVKMYQNHICGSKGVIVRPNVMKGGRPYDRLNDEIAAAWSDWQRPKYASASGRLSWVRLQRLAVAEWVIAGEALLQIVLDPANPYGITLQPIDADRLDHRLCRDASAGKNAIRYGVEMDRVGKPIAYHILRRHPNDRGDGLARGGGTDVVPADQIIYLAGLEERVDLTRGIPELAVALRDLRHIDGAQEASLVAMRVAASAAAFITTTSPDAEIEPPAADQFLDLEPGSVPFLGLNQSVQSWTPHAPADNFPDFNKSVLRAVAAGLGTTYASMANDLSDANYSSMRVGRAEEQETWMAAQEWLIETLIQPVYEAWLKAALLAGRIPTANYDLARITPAVYRPRRWTSVDPVKDVESDERRVALGVSSRQEIKGREGGDLWETWEQLREEAEYAETMDLNVEPPRKGASNAGQQQPNDDDTSPASGDDADAGAAADDKGRGHDGGGRPDPRRAIVGGTGRAVRLLDR